MQYGGIMSWSVVCAISLASPALAQQTKRLDAQLTARVTYDDNVARSNSLLAAQRGVAQEDVIFSPTLTVDIVQPVGRQALFLNGSVGYVFHQENERLDRERIALRGGGILAVSSCVTTVTGGYSRRQSELDELTVAVTENVETITSIGVDAVCGKPIGFAPMLSASQQWAENSAGARVTSDYVTQSVMGGLSYRRPTFGDLSVFANYGKTDYENRFLPAGAGFIEDGFESYGGGVRYTRQIGARLQGTVTAGYTSVRPNLPSTDDFEGFTYGADLTYRPSGRIQVRGLFARNVTPSNRLLATYSIDDTYSLDATYAIGSRIRLGLGGAYRDSSYEGPGRNSGLLLSEEQVRSLNASVRFNMSRRLAFMLEASQQERDANVHGLDYTANRVGLSIVATY